MSERHTCVKDIIRIIHDISKTIFRVNTDQELVDVFGMNEQQLQATVEQMVAALPERFFLPNMRQKLEEIKAICAREFIFFQVQEKYLSPEYQANQKNFIRILVRDLERKM